MSQRTRFHEGPPLPIQGAIHRWWKAFAAKAADIDAMFSQGAAFDLVAFMHEHLGAVDPRLMWEFGPAVAGGRHRLVLTPETDRHMRPLTDAILAAAPSGTGFEFYSGRLAEPMDHAMATVQGRTGLSVEGWGLAVRATEALEASNSKSFLDENNSPATGSTRRPGWRWSHFWARLFSTRTAMT